jgi:hypothetical protein
VFLNSAVPAKKKKKGQTIRPGFEEDMAKQLQKRIAALQEKMTDDENSQLNQSSVSYSYYGTE